MQEKIIGDFSRFPTRPQRGANPGGPEKFRFDIKQKKLAYFLIFLMFLISVVIVSVFFIKGKNSPGQTLPERPPSAAEGGI